MLSPASLPEGACVLERERPSRVVVIGDLNGHVHVLQRMLLGLRLIKKNGAWRGGRTVVVQIGDIPNRGPSPRKAMQLILDLQAQARAVGGDVIWLLGNHEVLSVLRHEAYVSVEEYLEYATQAELESFYAQRLRRQFELLVPEDGADHVAPVGGRLRAWEEENAPGKAAYRAEMGPDGRLGRAIRSLPIAVRIGSFVLAHGGVSPRWAELGYEGIETKKANVWAGRPRFYEELHPECVLRDPFGPLWNRAFALAPSSAAVRKELDRSLDLLGAKHMVVGHTRTDSVNKGKLGVPAVRHGRRLLMVDVGLGDPGEAGAALVIEKGRVEIWSPGGSRSRAFDLS